MGLLQTPQKPLKQALQTASLKKTAQARKDKSVKFTKKYAPLKASFPALKHLSKS